MSLYDSLRKALTPELFTQVTDALGDDFDYDVVPRARLNKVIKQRNELREELSGGSQSRSGKAKGSDEDDDDMGASAGASRKSTEVNVEELKKQWLKEQGDAVQAVKLQYAALEKLRAAKVIDPELIWSSNILDKSKISLDDKGNVVGMDDMLTQLQKDKAHLFKKAEDDVPGGTGKNESGDDDKGGSVSTRDEFLKLSIDQQIAFKKANPEVFKSFMQ